MNEKIYNNEITNNTFRWLINVDIIVLGYSVPIFMPAVIIILSLLISRALRPRKKEKWRIRSAKKWLKDFRSNADKYNSLQRFNYIRKVDHFLWEYILMRCFEERGYSIIYTPLTRDGGSDGFVTINGEFIVIQAKRYKGRIAKADVVKLNNLVKSNKRFKKGLFIHTGKSSDPIIEYFHANEKLEQISGVSRILNFLDGGNIELFGVHLKRPKGVK